MPRNPLTPHRLLEFEEEKFHDVELVATLRAFALFKQKTGELGLGEPLREGGRPAGLSILRGDLEALDEVTIPALVWALAHGEDNAGAELDYPTMSDVEDALQLPATIMRALVLVSELIEEAVGDPDEDVQEEEEGEEAEGADAEDFIGT